MAGRRSASGTTYGAADAQEVDVPAHDEQWVRNIHLSRITHSGPVCPALLSHTGANLPQVAAIPAGAGYSCNVTASSLPDPAERRFRRGLPRVLGRQVLAVTPGAAPAILVVPPTARDANHSLYCAWRGYSQIKMASAFAERRAAGARRFPDRADAGLLLADRLKEIQSFHPERTVVAALPRGGVPVGAVVARCLHIPLEVLVTRKIGHPDQPELGLGAIAEGGEPVFDETMLDRVGLRPGDLARVVARERAELARRVAVYRGDRPPPAFAGRDVIVVDDGLATGVTARAALRAVRARGAARTVLAVPVASAPAIGAMKGETDEVVTVVRPRRFRSVGEWYAEFGQLTDADVLTLLAALR
jgi:putative phosphoribosyl transferase